MYRKDESMRSRSIELQLRWPPVVMLLATAAIGCGAADLKGYRPASEQAAANPDSIRADNRSDPSMGTTQKTLPETTAIPRVSEAGSIELIPVSALVPVNVVQDVRGLMNAPGSKPRETENPASENGKASDLISTAQPEQATSSAVESATASKVAATGPNHVEVLIKEKKFQTDSKTGALRVSFDDLDLLKVLNMEPVTDNAVELMPAWLKGLEGKTIRIRGFMYPTYETEGIERFVLARDNQICCFGRDPKIYDLVQIDMKAGKTTNYIPATRAFDVTGKLKMEMLAEDGKPYGLYVLEDATVIDR